MLRIVHDSPPPLLSSFLSVILRVSPLLIFHLFLLFCHCQPLLTDTCVPYILERNRSSSSADNTNRNTSHLLHRLMSVIYHIPVMGFRMCVPPPPCYCSVPPPHSTVCLNPSPSVPPSLSAPLYSSSSPCVSVSEDLVRSSVSLCVCAGEAGKE